MFCKPIKTMGAILLLFFSCFLIIGCSKENLGNTGKVVAPLKDKNEASIRSVLEKEFTGPDEEYIRLEEAVYKIAIDNEESLEELPEMKKFRAYIKETYSSHFTESGLNSFINTGPAFIYHSPLLDYQISITNIAVVQSDNPNSPKHYNFTAQVEYENNTGVITKFEISGMAICSEEGKIGKIRIDDGGLLKKIDEDTK